MAEVMRNLAFALALFLFWIVLSWHFSWIFLSLGLVSCLFVLWLTARMQMGGDDGAPVLAVMRLIKYSAWLLKEIAVSNIKVARIILDPALPVRPVLFYAPSAQKTPLGTFIFANSITLTPGTISVDISDSNDRILVHALHEDLSWGPQGCEMDTRLAAAGL